MAVCNTALFLAAGQGMRLGPLGRSVPKGLMELGGKTLMDHALDKLQLAGVSDIVIVSGHLHQQYEALARRRGSSVQVVHNPDFATRGSGHSLLVGLGVVVGSVLVLESDIIWERHALEAISTCGAENTLLLSGPTNSGDEVWVWGDASGAGQHLRDMSKDRSLDEAAPRGELVGMTRLGSSACAHLRHVIARREADDPMADYESCLVAASLREPIFLKKVDDLAWAEIDDMAMLAHAEDIVFPKIQQRDAAVARE